MSTAFALEEEPQGMDDPRSARRMSVAALHISPSQRPVNETRVARIAADWDWKKAEAVTVAERPFEPGHYDVIEGQNRVMALRGIDPNATIMCIILPSMTSPEQAGTALAIGEGRRPVSALEKFRLRCTKGDQYANAARDVLIAHGLFLDTSHAPRHTKAASAIMNIVQGGGKQSVEEGTERLSQVFDVILKAWPNDPTARDDRFTADILSAVAIVLREFEDKKVAKLLKRRGFSPVDLLSLSGTVSKRERIVRMLRVELAGGQ